MWDVIVRAVTALLMIGLPLALFLVLRAKVQATWRIIGIGAATFVASQVVHIPLKMFILLPLLQTMGFEMGKSKGAALWFFAFMIGLSAGLCEEVAQYLVYRHWLSRSERRYKVAVSLGGGHGGCEAILLGIISMVALVSFSYLRHEDLDKILPPEQETEQALADLQRATTSLPPGGRRQDRRLPPDLFSTGTRVQFKSTKTTKGGTGTIIGYTNGRDPFAIIRRDNSPQHSTPIHRKPSNLKVIDEQRAYA